MHITLDTSNPNVHFVHTVAEKYELISRELVRVLRGRRSQVHLSRRLGYRSNALYTWEAGSAFPSAARFFEMCERVGVDIDAALRRFYRELPESLREHALSTPEGVRRLLKDLLGRTRIVELARASGLSRFMLSRVLAGRTQPNLPELLCIVDHASLRLLDFLSIAVDPAKLPAVADAWARLQQARRIGYDRPLTQAVLRALETEAYRRRPSARTIAALTGIARAEVDATLTLLLQSAQVTRKGGSYAPASVQVVDFRRDPQAAQSLKAFWAEFAAERSKQPRAGLFAYNVFSVSRADLVRLQELQRAYLREMRRVIAESEPSEAVALLSCQLFALDA